MKNLLISTIVFVVAGLAISPLMAKESKKAIIILDASGSMLGKVDGVTKIEIAKKTLSKLVTNWDESIELGMLVYGHRKKGDCNDMEMIYPIAKADKNSILNKLSYINPKGKTPIAKSIKLAVDKLRSNEDKAIVTIITDGKDTCSPNACEDVKALKKSGVDFVANIIAFDVKNKDQKQLMCIADATGGTFSLASDEMGLNMAVGSSMKDSGIKVNIGDAIDVNMGSSTGDMNVKVGGKDSNSDIKVKMSGDNGDMKVRVKDKEAGDIKIDMSGEDGIRIKMPGININLGF